MFPGLDLYYTDPAQHLITAGEDPDDLDRDLSDLSDLSVRRVNDNKWDGKIYTHIYKVRSLYTVVQRTDIMQYVQQST